MATIRATMLVDGGVFDNTEHFQHLFHSLGEGDELIIPPGIYATGALHVSAVSSEKVS